MTKQEGLDLLKQHITKDSLIKHSLASYAVLKALAQKLGKEAKDVEMWAMAGLLHDVDSEITQNDMAAHGTKARSILEGKMPEEAISSIEAHNEHNGIRPRETLLDHALSAGETITGLITAVALVHPDKKLASVKVKSILKRINVKNFAATVSRGAIMECERLGFTLEDFIEIALNAMQEVSVEIGL